MALDVSVLATADRGHVLNALASFANKSSSQWFPAGHPASQGQLPRWQKLNSFPAVQAIEAVAASGPNHCIDGWSYASRGLAALLAGDGHSARHLAYYAQLRAGLSILSNLGVGIFNRTNFVVTALGTITRLDTHPPRKPNAPGMGTHDIVWEALKEWTLGTQTSRLFLEMVKIGTASLKECLDAIWPGSSATGAASTLIEAWGVDLKRGKDEHKNRNISSYSPQAMNPLGAIAPDGLRFVKGFWDLFEPTSGTSFDNLDRYLLRSLLLKQHRTITNNSSYSTGAITSRYHELPPMLEGWPPKYF